MKNLFRIYWYNRSLSLFFTFLVLTAIFSLFRSIHLREMVTVGITDPSVQSLNAVVNFMTVITLILAAFSSMSLFRDKELMLLPASLPAKFWSSLIFWIGSCLIVNILALVASDFILYPFAQARGYDFHPGFCIEMLRTTYIESWPSLITVSFLLSLTVVAGCWFRAQLSYKSGLTLVLALYAIARVLDALGVDAESDVVQEYKSVMSLFRFVLLALVPVVLYVAYRVFDKRRFVEN